MHQSEFNFALWHTQVTKDSLADSSMKADFFVVVIFPWMLCCLLAPLSLWYPSSKMSFSQWCSLPKESRDQPLFSLCWFYWLPIAFIVIPPQRHHQSVTFSDINYRDLMQALHQKFDCCHFSLSLLPLLLFVLLLSLLQSSLMLLLMVSPQRLSAVCWCIIKICSLMFHHVIDGFLVVFVLHNCSSCHVCFIVSNVTQFMLNLSVAFSLFCYCVVQLFHCFVCCSHGYLCANVQVVTCFMC